MDSALADVRDALAAAAEGLARRTGQSRGGGAEQIRLGLPAVVRGLGGEALEGRSRAGGQHRAPFRRRVPDAGAQEREQLVAAVELLE